MLSDWVKAPIILFMYCVVAPAIAFYIKDSRQKQRRAFALLVFMTSWQINKITMMLDSIDWYRGATKGFEFGWMDVMAIALLMSSALKKRRPWRRLAPGTLLYLLYIGCSLISIFHAPEKVYTLMAAWRFSKAVLVYVAAFHFLRDEEDLLVFLRTLAMTLIVQMFVVLKMKYKDHIFQVMGWFEHQNALAMWSYMCGFALLAAGLGEASKKDTTPVPGGLPGLGRDRAIGAVAGVAGGVRGGDDVYIYAEPGGSGDEEEAGEHVDDRRGRGNGCAAGAADADNAIWRGSKPVERRSAGDAELGRGVDGARFADGGGVEQFCDHGELTLSVRRGDR